MPRPGAGELGARRRAVRRPLDELVHPVAAPRPQHDPAVGDRGAADLLVRHGRVGERARHALGDEGRGAGVVQPDLRRRLAGLAVERRPRRDDGAVVGDLHRTLRPGARGDLGAAEPDRRRGVGRVDLDVARRDEQRRVRGADEPRRVGDVTGAVDRRTHRLQPRPGPDGEVVVPSLERDGREVVAAADADDLPVATLDLA